MTYDINILVKETGEFISATEDRWCVVREIKASREWYYCFEEMKGQPNPDFDYDEPILHVEKRDGSLQLTIVDYRGRFHVDVFAFNRVVWRNVGGPERRHVGESVIVELPEAVPAPPTPPTPSPPTIPSPAPPELTSITDRLDIIYALLKDIKEEIRAFPVMANTYSVVSIDLSTARTTLTEYNIGGFAITVFKCDGTLEIKLGDETTDTITIEPLTYPSMLVIDRMEFNRFFIRNTAQAGKQAILIVWRRE